MIYFLALIPATGLVIGGYLVFYLSGRSEGAFRTFGKYLGFWAFTLAALVILGAIFAAAHRGHHGHRGMSGMRGGAYGRMHPPWPGPRFFRPGMPVQRFGMRQAVPNGAGPSGPVGRPSSSAASSSDSSSAQ
jgi:hypothetical protein